MFKHSSSTFLKRFLPLHADLVGQVGNVRTIGNRPVAEIGKSLNNRKLSTASRRRFTIGGRLSTCPTIFLCAMALALSGQEKAPPKPPSDEGALAKFSSETNLVIIDVYARDKSGKIVTNLKKEDFTISEDGKPQVISVFELQQLEGELLPALPDQPKTLIIRNAPPAHTPAVKTPVEPAKNPSRFQDRRLMTRFFHF